MSCRKKRFLILCLSILIVFNFTGCKNTEQKNCKHEWYVVSEGIAYGSFYYTIYCPKCDFEMNISKVKWKEMEIKKEYYGKNR